MKVYVCFLDYGSYEGMGRPERVFTDKEKAEEWVKEEEFWRDYEELEVE